MSPALLRSSRAVARRLLVIGLLAGALRPVGAAEGDVADTAPPAAHAQSALAWDRKRLEIKAEPGQERAEGVFTFRNTGAKTVTITAVQTSCGCTTTELKKHSYAPGEAGEIRAIFTFGDRTGPQQKVLTVNTDDAVVATQLVLRVDIPDTLILDQRIVQWPRGEAAEAKTVTIHTAATGMKVEGLDFDAKQIEAKLEPLPDGNGYHVTLRPLSTAEPMRQTVQIRAKIGEATRSLPVYVYVR